MYLLHYLLFGECHVFRDGDPLFLDIIKAVNNSDDPSGELFQRLVHSEDVHVLLLAVGRDYSLDIAVIHGVIDIGVLWVKAAQWAVYLDLTVCPIII